MVDKYDGLADGFSEHDYAGPAQHAAQRAQLIAQLGSRLRSVGLTPPRPA